MRLIISTGSGITDVTQLVSTLDWSGDSKQVARTVQAEILASHTDSNVPVCDCPLGSGVTLMEDGKTLFSGWIETRERTSDGSSITITAIDRGIYLKRNEGVYKFVSTTAEAATARVCADFGISVGSLAATGIKLTRNFIGVDLYNIIETMYTLASQQNGKVYQQRFEGDKLCVRERVSADGTLILEGGHNLMDASVSESVDGLVNIVNIYDSSDKLIKTVKDDALVTAFGKMQSYLKKSDNEDAEKKAAKVLRDNGVDRKITVDSLGDVRCLTGNSIIVRETSTGLSGLFWIDEDTHSWKLGQYYNKLVLNYRNLMDETESGSAK
jgi:hypothetical protein